MNCTTANKMSIAGFLLSKGINPESYNNKSFLYCSPLRNEKTASFKVDRVKNIWYDFGTGIGGRLIDLVCQMYRVEVPGALLILSGAETPTQSFSFDQPQDNTESNLTIKDVKPLHELALIHYLESRKIPAKLAARYVQEIHYTIYEGQKVPFYAVAFKNYAGGYALRNGFKTEKFPDGLKLQTKPQMITIIPGNLERVVIYEGFISFLSSLVHYKQVSHRNTTIVLNSTNNLRHVWDLLPNFNQINLFLDNDANGKSATQKIQSRFPEAVNHSKILFPEYNDFNEFLNRDKQP